ncbi:MAG: hypothetical protein QM679_11380 [Patulibacter sp.]
MRPDQPKASVRPYYIFTAVVFGLGMVLSVIAESWSSFFIFTVLCATFVWIAARVERPAASGSASQAAPRPRRRLRERRAGRAGRAEDRPR